MEYINYDDIIDKAINAAMANMSFEDDMVLTCSETKKLKEEIDSNDEIKKILIKRGKDNGQRRVG